MELISAKLITYNRAPSLERTLTDWFSCGLRDIPLEVLDNASTDCTSRVIDAFRIKGISVLTHQHNIGVCGNILRATERFTSKYCWLLCDDDIIDKSAAPALLDAITSQRYDALIVGAPERASLPIGRSGSGSHLRAAGARLYHTMTFLPATIYDRKFLDDGVLMRCNKAASTAYPHLPLIDSIIANASNIRIADKLVFQRAYTQSGKQVRISGVYQIAAAAQYVNKSRRKLIYRDIFALQVKSAKQSFIMFSGEKYYQLCSLPEWVLLLKELRLLGLKSWIVQLTAFMTPRWLFRLAYLIFQRKGRQFGDDFVSTDRL